VLVYIIFPDGEPSANAEFALARNNGFADAEFALARNNGFADAEFTSVIELHAPLYSDSNIKNMQSLCNQFTQSIKKWIQEKK